MRNIVGNIRVTQHDFFEIIDNNNNNNTTLLHKGGIKHLAKRMVFPVIICLQDIQSHKESTDRILDKNLKNVSLFS